MALGDLMADGAGLAGMLSHRTSSGRAGQRNAEAREPVTRIDCDNRPTVLLTGSPASCETLAIWAERAGLRCIGSVPLGGIAERLERTVAVNLILADLRRARLDSAAARALALRPGLGDARLAVLTDLDGLDDAHGLFDGPGAELLCMPSAADIVSLLVLTGIEAERARAEPQFHDPVHDGDATRIDQLSEQVRRLAVTIERLARDRDTPGLDDADMLTAASFGAAEATAQSDTFGPADSATPDHGEIRALLRARRLREHYLPEDLFADPAWDMMLDLMAARLSGQRVSVSSLCIAAAVPPTTALRWIRQLTDRGIFSRIDDPADGRRVFIALTDEAAEAVTAWALAVRRTGGLLAPRGRD